MKSNLFLALIAASSLVSAAPRYVPAEGDVLVELSHRSNLPEADLKQSLANCDANQTNTNLCAYRDQVAADLTLKHAVAEWEKARDAGCAKSAEREYGGGSLKPTAQAMCVTAETKKMIQRVERAK
ncbi:lysozyme inhibitor LprI family protein [Collimonas arenae]|uniref:lysozyme inhibitor LprI family protein n=1 Tax=Collimonas arenae TaxID=279058 RepID=UPI0006921E6C|nr:lysozyme inhibitor LprI family protein [Collimonas arenae]